MRFFRSRCWRGRARRALPQVVYNHKAMRIGYLECFSGISGNMLLGALVDAGVPFDALASTAAALGVGARLEMRKVDRGGLAGIKVDVVTQGTGNREQGTEKQGPRDQGNKGTREQGSKGAEPAHSHSHSHEPHEHEHPAHEHHSHDHEHAAHVPYRSLSAILAIIQAAPLTDTVKQWASHAFQLLGEAEAAIHSIPIEMVHFHEVGAVDTIVDIVCAAAGAEFLAIDRWLASPLNVDSGT